MKVEDIEAFFKGLQDDICQAIEAADGIAQV
jgi:coproporphyrinogen III oxidase